MSTQNDMAACKAMVAELKGLGAKCQADSWEGGLQVLFGCYTYNAIKSEERLAKVLAHVKEVIAKSRPTGIFGNYEVRIAR